MLGTQHGRLDITRHITPDQARFEPENFLALTEDCLTLFNLIGKLWNFTSLGLSFSKYSAILAKSPPNKIPVKFHLLRKFPHNSICSGLGLNSNLPEIPPCVWCTTEWHHTNTKRKAHLLVWMTQSHAMSNFCPFSACRLQDNVATSTPGASSFM